MSEAVNELVGKVDALTGAVNEIVVTLGEVKAALDNAVNAQDMAAVQECSRRIDALISNLQSAETAADITPDDVPPGDGGTGTDSGNTGGGNEQQPS